METTMTDHADAALIERIQALTAPMRPVPTGAAPRIEPLEGIRAVLFDVYGTLVISGCGDIGLTAESSAADPFQEAWSAAGLDTAALPPDGPGLLAALIHADHAQSRGRGVDHPEVDILAIWRRLLDQRELSATDRVLRRLALEYELRTNPVWPMPGLAAVIDKLSAGGPVLGIVSNAQFYTPLMLGAFLGEPLDALGFDPDCCAWSYRQGVAKPSQNVYAPALRGLTERHGIAPAQVLYIGNDMRNDVRPAQALGCRTALFAGDARSLRLRADDPGMRDIQPDRVITSLDQVLDVLRPA
jgi:putative hydrolase of the HAD superfamily